MKSPLSLVEKKSLADQHERSLEGTLPSIIEDFVATEELIMTLIKLITLV